MAIFCKKTTLLFVERGDAMNAKQIQRNFIRQVSNFDRFRRLMEHLPDVYFFVKNRKSQLMMGNKLFLVKCGLKNEMDIVGKTDYELFPEDRVENYLKDDRYVMETGNEIVNRVELAPDRDGSFNWFITTKIPLYSEKGRIVGLAAIARDGQKTKTVFLPYFEITWFSKHHPLLIFQRFVSKQPAKGLGIPVKRSRQLPRMSDSMTRVTW